MQPQLNSCQNSSFERCFPKPYSLLKLKGGHIKKWVEGKSRKKTKKMKRKEKAKEARVDTRDICIFLNPFKF